MLYEVINAFVENPTFFNKLRIHFMIKIFSASNWKVTPVKSLPV